MLKLGILSTLILSATAYVILQYSTVYLSYYYAVLVSVGAFMAYRTGSGAYKWLAAIVVVVYAVENNAAAWHSVGS